MNHLISKLGRKFKVAEFGDIALCSKERRVRLVISPNEVFGDIMVLASPPPRPRPPRRR